MQCPYCAEQVKDDAVICKHCYRDLTSMRLHILEESVQERVDAFEEKLECLDTFGGRLLELDREVKNLEAALGIRQDLQVALEPDRLATWSVYIAAFLVGTTIPIWAVYRYLIAPSRLALLLPFVALIAAGAWMGLADRQRSVKRYILSGLLVGIVDFYGFVTVILRVIYGWTAPQGVLEPLPIWNYWQSWSSWSPALLFVAPLCLVVLGGFLGEWLESRRPSGQKMSYSTELAEQLARLSAGRKHGWPEADLEKVSKVLAVLAPLISAIGGIVAPIIAALVAN